MVKRENRVKMRKKFVYAKQNLINNPASKDER